MTPDRWTQIESIFGDAADRPPDERAAFLDDACRTADGEPDADLRREIEAMLADDTQASAFFGAAADGVARAADGATTQPPERAGPWLPVRLVGRGGMGEVYLAERSEGGFEQRAALKLIQPGLAPELVERFRTERAILAGLEHPGIARLLDGGVASDGRPYLATEFVDGQPITDYADEHRLSVEERLRLFEDVCRAVAYAHRNLVVHRDIKPSNILVDTDGRVKLLDFGIARLLDSDDTTRTLTGQRAMTPAYAAPEQVRGDRPTTATDAYALGVLLYELLTGRRPYALPSVARRAVEQAILEAQPTRPSTAVESGDATADAPTAAARAAQRKSEPARLRRRLTGDLDQIVLKALRKEPDRRYGSAAELADDVQRHLAGEPVAAQPDTWSYRARTFVRRNRLAVGAAATVAFALVAGTSVALWQASEARAAQAEAETEATTAVATTDFLVGLFEASDPSESRGDSTLVLDVLRVGANRLNEDLRDEPTVRARLQLTLGRVYKTLGRLDAADSLLTTSLASGMLSLYDGIHARSIQAEIILLRGDLDGAVSSYERLVDETRAWKPRHPDTEARLLTTLGLVYSQIGRPDDAERTLRAALALRESISPEPSVELGNVVDNLGFLAYGQGDYENAIRFLRRGLSIQRQLHGNQPHPDLAISLDNMGSVYRALDSLDVAHGYVREAFAMQARLHPEPHPNRAITTNNYGTLLMSIGNYDEAERVFTEALEMKRTLYGADNPTIAATLNQMGVLAGKRGNWGQSVRLSREAVAAFIAAQDPGHANRIDAYMNLAAALASSDQAQEAEAVYLRGYREALGAHGSAHPIAVRALGYLPEFYTDQGRTAEAARWQRTLDAAEAEAARDEEADAGA